MFLTCGVLVFHTSDLKTTNESCPLNSSWMISVLVRNNPLTFLSLECMWVNVEGYLCILRLFSPVRGLLPSSVRSLILCLKFKKKKKKKPSWYRLWFEITAAQDWLLSDDCHWISEQAFLGIFLRTCWAGLCWFWLLLAVPIEHLLASESMQPACGLGGELIASVLRGKLLRPYQKVKSFK